MSVEQRTISYVVDAERVICPVCGQDVALVPTGHMRPHGPRHCYHKSHHFGSRDRCSCPGSGYDVDELTRRKVDEMRGECPMHLPRLLMDAT